MSLLKRNNEVTFLFRKRLFIMTQAVVISLIVHFRLCDNNEDIFYANKSHRPIKAKLICILGDIVCCHAHKGIANLS